MKKWTILVSIIVSSLFLIASLVGCQSQAEPPEDMTAQWYYDQGCQLANSGRYDEARNYLDKAIEVDSNFAEAYGDRGMLYFTIGDYDKAIIDLDECFRLRPEYGTDTWWAYLQMVANCVLAWKAEGLVDDVFPLDYTLTHDGEIFQFAVVTAVVPGGTLDDEIETNKLTKRMDADYPVASSYDLLLITLCEQAKREIPEDLLNMAMTQIPECP